jgi:hypothetical protein|tara:strand:+ start:154 stop:363 length:210 start_codon:yes stop_codon:yes gene_type:complete
MEHKGMKYIETHKRWISQAKELIPQVPDFKPDFVRSLNERVDSGIPLTPKQFKSLKKVVFFLKCKVEGK